VTAAAIHATAQTAHTSADGRRQPHPQIVVVLLCDDGRGRLVAEQQPQMNWIGAAVERRRRRRLVTVAEELEEVARHRLGREADRSHVFTEEGAAVDTRGPSRQIAALEGVEQRCLDLRRCRDRRDWRPAALAFALQSRAKRPALLRDLDRCHELG
jgi:hypothetical protein